MGEFKRHVGVEPFGRKRAQQLAVAFGGGRRFGAIADALAEDAAGNRKAARVGRTSGPQKIVGGFTGDETPGAQPHPVTPHGSPYCRIAGRPENRRSQRTVEQVREGRLTRRHRRALRR